jgi:hypothetical protein
VDERKHAKMLEVRLPKADLQCREIKKYQQMSGVAVATVTTVTTAAVTTYML